MTRLSPPYWEPISFFNYPHSDNTTLMLRVSIIEMVVFARKSFGIVVEYQGEIASFLS